MAPDYHQLEFDLRLYLTHIDASGERLWGQAAASPTVTTQGAAKA